MSKIKLPAKIKVAGQEYTIVQNYIFKDDTALLGMADHYLGEIRLRLQEQCGVEVCEDRQWIGFFHELLHCISHHYNAHRLDEDTVTRLASGLYQALKDNKIKIGGG